MRQPRSITLLFAAAGVCLLYSFAQQVSQPPLILRASQPPAIAAVPDASAAAMLSSVAQQSHSTPISPAASAAFWLPPAGTPSAARATSPVSGCAPAPGNQQAQRAPILLARGKGNPGCAAAAGAASGLQVPPDQVVACALAAAATDGELLLLSGGRPLRSLSHALTLSHSHTLHALATMYHPLALSHPRTLTLFDRRGVARLHPRTLTLSRSHTLHTLTPFTLSHFSIVGLCPPSCPSRSRTLTLSHSHTLKLSHPHTHVCNHVAPTTLTTLTPR